VGIIFAFSIIKIEEKMINSKTKCRKRLEKKINGIYSK